MGERKAADRPEKTVRKAALGGRIVAVLSILFLVPVIRRLREQRQPKRRRHFPLLGH